MLERKCARCDTSFQSRGANNVYCSRDCYLRVNIEKKRREPRTVNCSECGTEFTTSVSGQKRCSRECTTIARQRYHRERDSGADLFEQPLEFKTLSFKRLPDGFTFIDIGDLHIPFQDVPTLECVELFWNDLKPDLEVVHEVADFYAISPFDQNPSRIGKLKDEIKLGRTWLEKRANKNPSAKRVFMEGNHEDRFRRFLWRHGPDLAGLDGLTVEEQFRLKDLGYQHLTYRSVVDLLGCRVEHGYRASKSAAFPMNVANLMARATNSSGICGHTHRINEVHWTDARGSHSYRESGCLCRFDLEFAPFPNWQHGFTYGVVHKNRVHLTTVPIYEDGFRAEGTFYPRTA